jgi:adenylate cyclase
VRVINRYLGLMSEPIRRNQGIIDKYIGDGIMAFWGPPFSTGSDHARLACAAGIEQLAALPVFRAELPELTGLRRGGPAIDMRIGIATGDAIVGNIGSDLTMNYTVMGDTVNFASRLEGANKAYGTRLLISARTAALAAEVIACREIDLLRVEGKLEPERVFDVLGRRGEVPEAVTTMAAHFADGLAAYRRRDWRSAQAAFEAALAAQPEDGPTRVFLDRLKSLDPDAIPADWDGVWVLHEK